MTTRTAIRLRTRAEPAPPPGAGGPVGTEADGTMPVTGPLLDGFGRVHRDLRISVTDRCNLRCTYCMPEEGMTFLPREQLLTFEEIGRVATVAHRLGIEGVRLSGGEPLLRRDLQVLVGLLAAAGFGDVSLTTNAMLLAPRARALAAAGLRRVNVSCDSLDPDRFASIRRGGDLARVLAAMDAAEEAGLAPVKLNVVLMRGVNDQEIERFCAFGREKGRTVRFIEFMPLDAAGTWERGTVVPSTEVLDRIAARWDIEPVDDGLSAPATRYRYSDGGGEVGVIASVTAPFCGTCDRLRLTAEGQVRNCLFAREEIGLREILRGGGGEGAGGRGDPVDEAIEMALRRAVWRKRAGHGIGEPGFVRPQRTMSMIGG